MAIVFIVWQGLPYLSGGERSSDGSSTQESGPGTVDSPPAGTSKRAGATVRVTAIEVPAVDVAGATFTVPQLWVIAGTGVIGVAWRDDCEDSAKVTKPDEFGEDGTATRAGTVWGAGTAVLEVPEEGGPDCADAPNWHYVVSADPDWVVNDDGDTPKSWVHKTYLEPSLGVEKLEPSRGKIRGGCGSGGM